MKRVAFTGYYGMGNFGDDLFGHIASKQQLIYWPQYRSVIVGPPISGVGADFLVPERLAVTYGRASLSGRCARLMYGAYAAAVSEKFIYCGGSIFSRGAAGVRIVADRLAGKRASGIGVSIGPFQSRAAETEVRETLKRFEFLAVRDKASFAIAETFRLECKLVLSGDLAGMRVQSAFKGPKKMGGAVAIGFSPGNWKSGDDAPRQLCRDFAEAVARVAANREVQVVVLTLCENQEVGDSPLGRYAVDLLKAGGVKTSAIGYSELGIDGTLGQISSFDVYVTARLHGAIPAYLHRVPFALVEYHNKCTEFLLDISQHESVRISKDNGLKNVLPNMLNLCQFPGLPTDTYQRSALLNFTAAPWSPVNPVFVG